MSMNIAIIGSRKYVHPEDVVRLIGIIAADDPSATIISGGAVGIDSIAEGAARDAGLNVRSYRVEKVSDLEYTITEWVYGGQGKASVRRMIEQPTFATYVDALFFRNTLIVDRADRVVAFWNEMSEGTKFGLGYARDRGKPVKLWTEKERLP